MVDTSDEDELVSNYNDNEASSSKIANVGATSTGRVAKNIARTAGPSKPSTNGRGRKRKEPSPIMEENEMEVDIDADQQVEEDEDEENIVAAPPSQAKGKGKAKVASKTSAKSQLTRQKEGYSAKRAKDAEADNDTEDNNSVQGRLPIKVSRGALNKQSDGTERRLRAQLERLQHKMQQVTSQRDQLALQLQEVFAIRNSDAEQALELQSAQYEARLKTQEEMIEELTSQLARVDSLTRTGKTSTLHFLTREAADEERRGLERKLRSLTEIIAEKERNVSQRDAKLSEQEDIIRVLRSDLTAEIENTKAITSRSLLRDPPSSASKGPRAPAARTDESKNGRVIRLYEDFTNLLVINVKYEDLGEFGEEETVYKCVFSHNKSTRSLNFSLRIYKESPDAAQVGSDARQRQVIYTPLELDKEDQVFVETLDYLAQSFTFNATQLDVFLTSLNTTMDSMLHGDENAEQSDV